MNQTRILALALLLFGLDTAAQNPGGVAGAAFWVRADAGVTGTTSVSQWDDQSGNNNHAVEGTPGQQPSLVGNVLNFNPVIDFSDPNDIMSLTTAPTNTNSTFFVVGIPRINTNYRTMFRGTVSDHPLLMEAGNDNLGYFDNDNVGFKSGGLTWAQNEAAVVSVEMLTNTATFTKNGTVGTTATGINFAGLNINYIGNCQCNNQRFGSIAEAVIYPTTGLTASQKNRIETYLALKYGLTLTHDYVATDGTIVWNYTTNAGFNSNITGIANDGVLNKQKSQSANSGAVTLEKASALNANEFIIAGDNGLTGQSTNISGSYAKRSSRVWKAAVRGTPGNISISVNLQSIIFPSAGAASYYTLLTDADGDFSAGATVSSTGASITGTTITFNNVALASNQYYTVAISTLISPGGVDGAVFWVKGDRDVVGTTDVSQWGDQSGTFNHATQGTPANQPTLVANSINGHAVVNFTANTDLLNLTSPPLNLNSTIFTVAAPMVNTNWRTMFRGANDHPLLVEDDGIRLGYYDNGGAGFLPSGFNWLQDEVAVVSTEMLSGNINYRKNGSQGSNITSVVLGPETMINFGNYQGQPQAFGRISETIIFNTVAPLTVTEKQKVESYLAIKHGVTLTHDYLASDGVILWDLTANSGFSTYVTGIGRDDASTLDQQQSTTIHATGEVSVNKGTSFPGNKDFILWGRSSATGTSSNVPSSFVSRSNKMWRVSVRGTPGTVSLSINLGVAGIPNSGTAADYALLIDSDTDFSTVATAHTTGVALVGDVLSFTNVSLAHDDYFAIATTRVLPAGVTGMNVWLKANSGPEEAVGDPAETGDVLTRWLDRSGNARHYTVVTGPTLQDNTFNFNPSVEILSGGFDAPVGSELSNDWTLFFVSRKLASDNNGRVFDGHTGNYLWAHWGNYTNSIYIDNNPSNYNSGIATTTGIEDIHLHVYKRTAVDGTIQASVEGTTLATFTSTNSANGIRIDINQGSFSGESSHSRVAEMLAFNTPLATTDVAKVESYLAVKYGLTVAHNYTASDGTVIWNATTNATYHNNVTAIGRDDNSGLDQRKSLSINTGATVILDKGGAFANDKDFLAWGSSTASGTSTNVPGSYQLRTNRIWRVASTGTPGTVTFSASLVALGLSNTGVAGDYALLIDSDTDFSNASVHTSGATLLGPTISFTGVTLPNNYYFAVAALNTAGPGGLLVWLKADSGPEEAVGDPAESSDVLTRWLDNSGNGLHYIAATGTTTLQDNTLNFNPSVDVTSGGFDAPAGAELSSDWTMFFVSRKLPSDNNGRVFEGHSGNNLWAHWGNYTNSIFIEGQPSNYNSGIATTAGIEDLHVHSYKRTSSTGNIEARADGTSLATFGSTNSANGIRVDINRGFQYPAEASHSRIGEMIIFSYPLSAPETEHTETYLAVKYGLTIAHNYTASNGTVVWNSTTNATYHNNVAGIGRDDLTFLDQRRSLGINPTAAVTIDRGSAFSANRTYLIWGSNNLSGTSTNVPVSYTTRSAKIWKTAVAGTPGPVSFSADLTTLGLSTAGPASDYALLIDTDTDFSSGATIHTTGANLAAGVLSFTGVTFPNNSFFAIAYGLHAPGGVPGAVFWVMGDVVTIAGGNVNPWPDQSGASNHATQGTVANQPGQVTNDINGHASVDFSGANDIFALTTPPDASNSTFFAVAVPAPSTAYRTMFRSVNGDHHLLIETGTNRLGYYDPGGGNFLYSGLDWAVGEIALVGTELRTTPTPSVNFRKNGTQSATNITTINLVGQPMNYFGNYQGGPQRFGRIAETILFNTGAQLLTAEKERIESYLAVKYGITINHNYLGSDGTVLWNSTTNSTYHNDVGGIGRDDVTSLAQQTTRSINTGAVVTMDKGGAFGVDKSYLIWGNNTGAMNASGVTDLPASQGIVARVARVWKVETSGTPGAVSVSFDLTAVPGSVTATDLRLLIDKNLNGIFSDETVAGGGVLTGAAALGGNVYRFSGISFNDTELFTVGSAAVGTPLPITLLSLSASPDPAGVRLEWSTATELDNDRFIIQRSAGLEEFDDIAEVKGAGTSHQMHKYFFLDTSPLPARSYYRLRQIDTDGKTSTSHVVMVNLGIPIVLSPNPARDEVAIRGEGIEKSAVRIANTLGQQVAVNTTAVSPNEITIDVADLAPGIYFVTIQTNEGLRIIKLLIE